MAGAAHKPMAPELARIAQALARDGEIETRSMLASSGLATGGKVFAMFVRGCLVVKLPRERVAALMASGQGTAFESGGRLMKEWAVLPEETQDDHVALTREARSMSANCNSRDEPDQE